MTFAQTLKVSRIQENLTQSDLAQISQVSQMTISHIENGKVKPQSATKQKIEQVLGAVDWARTYDEGMIKQPV